MFSKPEPQHEWLQQLVGEWTSEAECAAGPDQPQMKSKGTETVRSLGGLWVVAEGKGDMPGTDQVGHMRLTIGYDPAKGKYVGSWVGSMMANQWVYEGHAEGNKLFLHTVGPDMSPGAAAGATANYRETIEILSPDHRTFSSAMQGADGQWTTFMTAHYRRAK